MMDETTMTIITMITIIAPDGAETVPFTADDLERAARGAGGRVPMKSDPEFEAAAETAYRVTAAELRQFVERFERLDAEKKDIADQQKEVMAEAKGRGYDTRALRMIIRSGRRDEEDDLANEQAVLEMYREALGM